MRNGSRIRFVPATLVICLCLPILMGQICQQQTTMPPGTTTLVNQTNSLNIGPGMDCDGGVVAGCQYQLTFIPTEEGKTVNVRVSGDIDASRIRIQVIDPNGNVVVNVDNPTMNISAASFTTTTVGIHRMTVTETALTSSEYATRVDQLP